MREREQNYKISEHAEMGKGTCEYDGLKNPQKLFQKFGQKNCFDQKFFSIPKLAPAASFVLLLLELEYASDKCNNAKANLRS